MIRRIRALPSLRCLGERGGVKTSVEEVGISGLFAFEDAEFDKSGAFACGKPVMGDGANRKLDVVEMDDEENDLVRQERKATRKELMLRLKKTGERGQDGPV